jgi:hypothetical protein
MGAPRQSPSPDPIGQRNVDHLRAAQVGLLTSADSQANHATPLEAQAFVFQAISVLSRVAAADSPSGSKVEAARVTPSPPVVINRQIDAALPSKRATLSSGLLPRRAYVSALAQPRLRGQKLRATSPDVVASRDRSTSRLRAFANQIIRKTPPTRLPSMAQTAQQRCRVVR